MQSVNFPLTKSPRVHKDAGISRGKTAGKLGRVVASNMQPMPLTWCPDGSRVLLGSLQHLFSHFVFVYLQMCLVVYLQQNNCLDYFFGKTLSDTVRK